MLRATALIGLLVAICIVPAAAVGASGGHPRQAKQGLGATTASRRSPSRRGLTGRAPTAGPGTVAGARRVARQDGAASPPASHSTPARQVNRSHRSRPGIRHGDGSARTTPGGQGPPRRGSGKNRGSRRTGRSGRRAGGRTPGNEAEGVVMARARTSPAPRRVMLPAAAGVDLGAPKGVRRLAQSELRSNSAASKRVRRAAASACS